MNQEHDSGSVEQSTNGRGDDPCAIWVTGVAYKGNIEHLRIHPSEDLARWDLIEYLRSYHRCPAEDCKDAMEWLASRSDVFSVVIEPQQATGMNLGHDVVAHLDHFLREGGFIVQTYNPANEDGAAHEAWAYRGPLNFDTAASVRFGRGVDIKTALVALDIQLALLAG